jgi:ferredoxin
MTKPNNDDIDIYELLSRADELLEEKEDNEFLADPAVFAPETEDPANSPMVYRNAANDYGQNIRNAANHYGTAPVRPQVQPPAPQPARPTQAEQAVSSIRAYNADFRTERERTPKAVPEQTAYIPPQPAAPAPAPEPPKKQKKKGGCLKKLLIPVALIAVVVILFNMLIKPPMTDSPIGERRPGVSTVLLCGADIGGQRTDTMTLLYVDAIKGEKLKVAYDNRHSVIIQDRGKCIKCGTCVKICKEVVNNNLLSAKKRGLYTYIGTAFDKGFPESCKDCLECVKACPVGALTIKKM